MLFGMFFTKSFQTLEENKRIGGAVDGDSDWKWINTHEKILLEVADWNMSTILKHAIFKLFKLLTFGDYLFSKDI